jgi:ApaG protein
MAEKNIPIHVEVETTYLDKESQPEHSRYLFAYTVTIRNDSDVSARLLSRYWKITGGNGHEQEVEGDGVIGLHPYLAPEQAFTYTSAAMLDTPVGMMQGHYTMLGDDGERFEVDIPSFTLAAPQTLH